MIPNQRHAFVTGSRVYGKPHADSDVDFVVRCSMYEARELAELLEVNLEESESYEEQSIQFRVGKLNLILCTTDKRFDAWAKGTGELFGRALQGETISREEACAHFAKLFAGEKP